MLWFCTYFSTSQANHYRTLAAVAALTQFFALRDTQSVTGTMALRPDFTQNIEPGETQTSLRMTQLRLS